MPNVAVGTTLPFHLVYAGKTGKGAIVNLDLTNSIIVAPTEGEAYQGLGNVNNYVVGPLNYVAVDGSYDCWIIALEGNPDVQFMPGVTTWAPSPIQQAAQLVAEGLATAANQTTQIGYEGNLPGIGLNSAFQTSYQGGTAASAFLANPGLTVSQEMAALVATGSATGTAGGVPLLAKPGLLITNAQTIPSGSAVVLGSAYLGNSLSYEIQAFLVTNASGVLSPFAVLELAWYADAALSILLYQENWVITGSTSGCTTLGTGPVRSAYLQAAIVNTDTANSEYLTAFYIYGNARPAPEPRSDWRSWKLPVVGTVPNYILPVAGQGVDDNLGVFSVSINANTTSYLLCHLYNGQIFASVSLNGTSPNFQVQPVCYCQGPTPGLQGLAPPVTGSANAALGETWNLPRAPLAIKITNNSATNLLAVTATVIAIHTD